MSIRTLWASGSTALGCLAICAALGSGQSAPTQDEPAAASGGAGWRNTTPRVARELSRAPAASRHGGDRVIPVAAEKTAESTAASRTEAPANDAAAAQATDEPRSRTPARRSTTSSSLAGRLPSDQGQVWQEYDISPFTTRVTSTKRPEQLVIDWILRDTGYETWHSDVVSVLSADAKTLRVYHTPEMQRVAADMVDRFANTQHANHAFGMRVVTVGSPNWRETATNILKAIPVQSQGVQAWLLRKEDAAVLLAQMSKRSDFREYSSPQLMVYNGQSIVLGSTRPRQYARSIIPRPNTFPPYEVELGRIDEGFSLEISPLVSLDGATTDVVIKCNINQIEKMVGMSIDIPLGGGNTRRERIEVPQMTSCDLHERFRWPTDQVLLVSRGVVATPAPAAPGLLPITLPGTPDANRADALVFIQSRGKVEPQFVPGAVAPSGVPAASSPSASSASAASIVPTRTGSNTTTQFRARR